MTVRSHSGRGYGLLQAALLITMAVYWPGLSGSWLFDDYPNIVDNKAVQPLDAKLSTLMGAALSSPSSEFKRPLASLSFAANYLATGSNPFWMKLTNLLIHLLNGSLVFLLARAILRSAEALGDPTVNAATDEYAFGKFSRLDIVAALIATCWMVLPINLTAVLYVVQRMESMANLFVLLGLIGYIAGRRSMLATTLAANALPLPGWNGDLRTERFSPDIRSLVLCLTSITIPTALGILAKETAAMLPLYALLIEWALFGFLRPHSHDAYSGSRTAPAMILLPMDHLKKTGQKDYRVIALFVVVLVLPMAIGLAWLLPGLLQPASWAVRDFTLGTRLLSEARVIADYIVWTLLPTPDVLSFYHDDFRISTGLLTPWTTLASMVFLAALVALMLWLHSRRPVAALGIAFFLGCQLLTGTIIPLELIYEHRNYFASFGLLLAVVPLLAVPRSFRFARLRYMLLAGLMLGWTTLTAMTAYAWGNPLRLAQELASRAPQSPRAQYELGRTYIIYSHYDPTSPFTQMAYAPLEKAAALPDFSILPEQALIFMNARMQLPLQDAWWDSIVIKLKAHPPGVQDESALASLTKCVRDGQCVLPPERMKQAFAAALSHRAPTARLLANYGDYVWNVLDDHALGLQMTEQAVKAKPDEPAYRITLIRMLQAQGREVEAKAALRQLEALDIGGRLDSVLAELRNQRGLQ